MLEYILNNAMIIKKDEIVHGHIRIKDNKIVDISSGLSNNKGSIDCEKDYISPGLVELHTDNLERHMTPRPKVSFPIENAILSHDRELASVGITTVFDALRVGSIEKTGKYKKYAKNCSDIISSFKKDNILKIDHKIHLRAETCSENLIDELDEYNQTHDVKLISIMDHTPGQRQFRVIDKYKEYLSIKYGMTENEMEIHFEHLKNLQKKNSKRHIDKILEFKSSYDCILASHDDTTENDVHNSNKYGVKLAEFPTTLEAAKTSKDYNIKVMMGSPNLLRGGSHSGNISAKELLENNCLDILSSDYIPSSLIVSVIKWGLEIDNLPKTFAAASLVPSIATNLNDRGSIDNNKRADLVRFKIYQNLPVIKNVWSNGIQVS
jgi:alpha-D-ribose 1-methylphosphonate 5-triphosphate diphosphatase